MATKEPWGMEKVTCLSTARRLEPLWYSFVRSVAVSINRWLLVLPFVAACSGAGDKNSSPKGSPVTSQSSTESTPRSTRAATGDSASLPAPDHTGAPRVLFLGTSLTAGYGLDDPTRDAYPSVIQRIADSLGVKIDAVNAGNSGETSAGALRRTDWLLKEAVDIVVIETGANDGLRGLNPDSTAANLREIVKKIRAAAPTSKILLVQMEAPTNLGAAYTRGFHSLFGAVAKETGVPLAPFLLDGVAGVARLNQGDGIHPTPEGARRAARNIWPSLARLLPPASSGKNAPSRTSR